MSASATLLYGFKVPMGSCPARMDEILEQYGKYDRYTLAWSLLELYGFTVDSGEGGDGDYVTDLQKKTGLTVETYGVENFYIAPKTSVYSVYDHGVQKITLRPVSHEGLAWLTGAAQKLGIDDFEPAWYLISDSD
jgi:hypothetical protein